MKLVLITLVFGLFFFVQHLPQASDSIDTRGAHLGGSLGGMSEGSKEVRPGTTAGGVSSGGEKINTPDTGWKSKPQTGEL